MRCKILHEGKDRLRVHIMKSRMTLAQADMLEYYLRSKPYVKDVRVYDRTGDAVILFTDRARVIRALSKFSYEDERAAALVPEHTGRELEREFEDRLFFMLTKRLIFKRLIPSPLRLGISVIKASRYVREALRSLSKGRIEVSLLDAVAITISLIRGEHKTASSVMFMLSLGELLEDWTHKKSVDDLARTMSLGVEKVWLHGRESDTLVPIRDICEGDEIVVRTGSMTPLDGKVISGVAKRASVLGKPVYALCGCRGEGAERILTCGVSDMFFSCEESKPFEEIRANCRADLYSAAMRMKVKIV